MISKEHRFHGQRSLSLAYRHGQTVRNQQMSVKYLLNRRRETYRAAVIVSKKVSKSAVERNRIRRRVYEVIHAHEPSVLGAYDIILTVFSAQLAEAPSGDLTKQIVGLLTKAGVMGGKGEPTRAERGIVGPNEDK